MKTCFVIGAMNYSGAEKVLSIIASELSNMGHDVSVILLEKKNGEHTTDGKIETYGVKSEGHRLYRIIKRWSNIRKAVKKISPDVVVSFGSVCNVNTIPSLLFCSPPLIVCERNAPECDPRKKIERIIRDILYLFADGFVFQTEKIKQYFPKSIQRRATVIPNPIIDTGKRWILANANKSISTVARLDNEQKDHISLLSAFAIFSKNHPDYILNIYGDGPDKQMYMSIIEKLGIEKKVVLHGKTDNPVQELLKSEIFILTSKFEGMPNALLEAMSIGLPCVSTNCCGGGAEYLFSIANTGLIVQVGDINSIAKSISTLVDNDELKIEYSKNAVNVNKLLDQRRISNRWDKFLKKIVKK